MKDAVLTDDAWLVSRAKEGDHEAFGQLVSRHERAMLAIARSYFASEDSVEDAVQEAFVKAFQAIRQIDNGSRFAGWMARITATTCVDTLRSRSDRVSLAEFASSMSITLRVGIRAPTPATLASKAEYSELLKAALGRLPEDQRVVLMLRYAEDMSYERIAAYIDTNVSTVRGRLHHAKRALRQILKGLESTGS
jgi:RNA polymerase sigma-70 factor (ECF subfamily)